MKTLKVKSILFSLLAMIALTVFITSCGQEELIEEIPANTEQQLSDAFVLPYGYDELPQDEQDNYMHSLTEEGLAELITCSKVLDYFRFLGKIDLIEANVKFGDILDESTLESYLTKEEISNFESFSADDYIESRGCSSWQYNGQVYRTMSCVLMACKCKEADVQKRDCWGWDFWRNRTRYVNWRTINC